MFISKERIKKAGQKIAGIEFLNLISVRKNLLQWYATEVKQSYAK